MPRPMANAPVPIQTKRTTAFGGGSAAGEVERGVGGEDGDRDGEENERRRVIVMERGSAGVRGGVIHGVGPSEERVKARVHEDCRGEQRMDVGVRRRGGWRCAADAEAPLRTQECGRRRCSSRDLKGCFRREEMQVPERRISLAFCREGSIGGAGDFPGLQPR